MKKCGNCLDRGHCVSCIGGVCPRWRPYKPTELERAQWWWCGWRRKGIVYKGNVYKPANRLEKAIHAQARKRVNENKNI